LLWISQNKTVRINFKVRAGSRRERSEIAQLGKPAMIEWLLRWADQAEWAIIEHS